MNLFGLNRSQSLPTRTLQTVDAHTLRQSLDQQAVVLVDVREAHEYATGHIHGAALVSLSTFDPGKIPSSADQKVVLYCHAGQRSAMAAQKLLQSGVSEVIHLDGGISAWLRAGYSVQ